MGRILAIDYGTKRTGLAVSDPLGIIAGALDTVPTHRALEYILSYASRNELTAIIVGKPTRMDGTDSETFVHIEPFVARLRKQLPGIEIIYWDERFTSVMAQRAIIEGGVPKMKRRDKALVDRVSAAIILQGYLDSNSHKK